MFYDCRRLTSITVPCSWWISRSAFDDTKGIWRYFVLRSFPQIQSDHSNWNPVGVISAMYVVVFESHRQLFRPGSGCWETPLTQRLFTLRRYRVTNSGLGWRIVPAMSHSPLLAIRSPSKSHHSAKIHSTVSNPSQPPASTDAFPSWPWAGMKRLAMRD